MSHRPSLTVSRRRRMLPILVVAALALAAFDRFWLPRKDLWATCCDNPNPTPVVVIAQSYLTDSPYGIWALVGTTGDATSV